MRRFMLVTILLVSLGTAGAHPHSYVDQQALLSLGSSTMDVTIRIVPSFDSGAAVFSRIDTDGSDVVSADEAAGFAAAVIAKARLEIDGQTIVFHRATATVPDIDQVSAGFGIIEIEATASFTLAGAGEHQVAFEIAYDEFSHDWQVQPYFYADFAEAMSSRKVARSDMGNQVGILFSSQSSIGRSLHTLPTF